MTCGLIGTGSNLIGLAIEVPRHTGLGLLESAYERYLCHELTQGGIAFACQIMIPVVYKEVPISQGFRTDVVIARQVILELKAVAAIPPAYEARLQTYLRISGIRTGLILNFDAPRLKDGLRRYVA